MLNLQPPNTSRRDALCITCGDSPLADLPEATAPAELRGIARDEVKLLVTDGSRVDHGRFVDLSDHLRPGDALVVNVSRTVPAALAATRDDGRLARLHLSTALPGDLHVVELREPSGAGTRPMSNGVAGEAVALPAGGRARLLTPYRPGRRGAEGPVRLWIAELSLPEPLHGYLDRHGAPIRYDYAQRPWSMRHYQTVFASEPGSAEMPSAGRAFSARVLESLAARGVLVLPVVLHCGVSSLEAHEPPHREYFRVPAETASLLSATRERGGRVVAVGTTVVRALESASHDGQVHAAEGWTDLLLSPERPVGAADGLITGFHPPGASHLSLLRAVATESHICEAYRAAASRGYTCHEFGDLHLLWADAPGRGRT